MLGGDMGGGGDLYIINPSYAALAVYTTTDHQTLLPT